MCLCGGEEQGERRLPEERVERGTTGASCVDVFTAWQHPFDWFSDWPADLMGH